VKTFFNFKLKSNIKMEIGNIHIGTVLVYIGMQMYT
jgi:hypothetical protein